MANMTSKPRGIYREQGSDGSQADVYVSFGRHGFSITADRYVHDGYSPAFNELPWKADYDSARQESPDR